MDAQTFAAVMGNSLPAARYQALLPAFNACLVQASCTTVNRVAMLVAQVGHESLGLKYMHEIWGPTAAQRTYQGRMGNTQPGDGKKYMGHGPLQITGKDNHAAVSRWAFAHGYVPTATYFVDNPDELAGDRYGFLGVVWYWTVARRMNDYADRGDCYGATKAVNGGTNGLADRTARWRRALTFGTRLLPTPQEDQLSQQFENDARARWPEEDQLDKDTRADLHAKQIQLDRIEAALALLTKQVAALSVQRQG